MSDDFDKAYIAGQLARDAGRGMDACPQYAMGQQGCEWRKHWRRGWADKDAELNPKGESMESGRPKAKKTARRFVYMNWRVLVDPRTGEEVRALVASSNTDRRILAARRFRADGRVRVEVKNPRHEGFHKLVHQFGTFLVMHVASYSQHIAYNGKPDSHAAVKDCQARSGAGCERVTYDMDVLGMGMMQVSRMEPRSISFDEMDEDEFGAVFRQMMEYVAENDYPDLDQEQVADFESLIAEQA